MKFVTGKMIISDVAKIVGFANDSLYVNKLLLQTKTDIQLKNEILNLIEI